MLPRTAQPLARSLARPRTRSIAPALHLAQRLGYSTQPEQSQGPSAPKVSSEQYQNRQRGGPFTLKAGALFVATGVGLYVYFQNEKKKVSERKRQENAAARVGRPKIGGPFKLVNQDGKEWGDQDMLGKWSLVYFGFTNCPDICPEELDKMTTVVDSIAKSHNIDILPVFITCDPARDDVKAVKTYVKDFHPSLVGLTGSYEDIKKTCKAYRVYFSTPPNASPSDDYLVDHSIFFYLMDPSNKFVDAFGRSMAAKEVVGKVEGYLREFEEGGGRGSWSEGQ
ncbi:Cu-binding protein [Rhodotorula toruloides]